MLACKNVMLICSRRHSRAFLTDILQAEAKILFLFYFSTKIEDNQICSFMQIKSFG